MSSEQYSLAWNDFQQAACKTFQDLYNDKQLCDVTIACEDGMQIKAHKIILISCSQFFSNVLLKNPHQHPLIYLKGIGHAALQSIIRFVYLGQTDVDQDFLDKFMEAAKELKIKGLCEDKNTQSRIPYNENQYNPTKYVSEEKKHSIEMGFPEQNQVTRYVDNPASLDFDLNQETQKLENTLQTFNDVNQYHNPIPDSRGPLDRNMEGKLECDLCDYQTINRTNFTAHKLTKHSFGRGGYLCEKCNQTFSSRGSLTNHTRAIHEGVRFPCDQCDFKGTQNITLKKHKINVHGM